MGFQNCPLDIAGPIGPINFKIKKNKKITELWPRNLKRMSLGVRRVETKRVGECEELLNKI